MSHHSEVTSRSTWGHLLNNLKKCKTKWIAKCNSVAIKLKLKIWNNLYRRLDEIPCLFKLDHILILNFICLSSIFHSRSCLLMSYLTVASYFYWQVKVRDFSVLKPRSSGLWINHPRLSKVLELSRPNFLGDQIFCRTWNFAMHIARDVWRGLSSPLSNAALVQ